MRKLGLTEKQHTLLIFIQKFTEEKGFSPSYQEMADHLGYANRAAVFRTVQLLKARGYVRAEEHSARSIIVNVHPDTDMNLVTRLQTQIRTLSDQVNRLTAELNAARRQAA